MLFSIQFKVMSIYFLMMGISLGEALQVIFLYLVSLVSTKVETRTFARELGFGHSTTALRCIGLLGYSVLAY